ncbi:MAG: thioredoxin domain-containing protein [Chloroflexi bacterium]|nr:thioredoxin domain-containing protein [Chloroflexota bacterium]
MSQNKTNNRRQGLIVIGAVVAIAVIVVGVAIAMSGNTGSSVDYSAIPQSRAADGGFTLGDPNAPVTIIEFADFACPHCQNYHPTMSRFINDYVATGQAAFEYRNFPSTGGALTRFMAQVMECSDEQQPGAFWVAHDLLYDYATTNRYTEDAARDIARELNINYSDLLTCTADANQINVDERLGMSNGVNGTPAVMIRYNGGPAQFITHEGVTYNRGSVPFDVLAAVVEANQS